jgi:hypothetical protein
MPGLVRWVIQALGQETNMSFRVKLALFVALALFGIAHATGAFMLSGTAATSVAGAKTIMHAGD